MTLFGKILSSSIFFLLGCSVEMKKKKEMNCKTSTPQTLAGLFWEIIELFG